MRRYCTQTIKVPFPRDVFPSCEYLINIPKAAEYISKIRLVTDIQTGLEYAQYIVNDEILESIPGDFINLEQSLILRTEQESTYLRLIRASPSYIELPFYLIQKGHFIQNDQVRIKFNNLFSASSAYLLIDYCVIDLNEPIREYTQRTRKIQSIKVPFTNSNQIQIDTAFVDPVFELYFVVTNTYGIPIDLLDNVRFLANDDERFNVPAKYLKYVAPLTYHKKIPSQPFGIYSFALYPEDIHEPSGSMNFSRLDRQRFIVDLKNNTGTYFLTIWAQSHNFVYNNKPIFTASEMLLDVVTYPSTIQTVPVNVSYINYLNTVTLFYTSPVTISTDIDLNNSFPIPLTYTKGSSSITFSNIDVPTYVIVTFSSPGYASQTSYFSFELPVSSNITTQSATQVYSNITSLTYDYQQHLLTVGNSQGDLNGITSSQNQKCGFFYNLITGISYQITGASFTNQISKIRSSLVDGGYFITGAYDQTLVNGPNLYSTGPKGFINHNVNPWTVITPQTPSMYVTSSSIIAAWNNGPMTKKIVQSVSCMYQHVALITTTGELYVAGKNDSGQLGLNDFVDRTSFVKVTTSQPVSQCATGWKHTLILLNDGTVWSTGLNGNGQLGLGTTTIQKVFTQATGSATQISCGQYHSACIKSTQVYTTGLNSSGQLGIGNTTDTSSFTVTVPAVTQVTKVQCGYNHTMLITPSGVYSTGLNSSGQLGLGDLVNRSSFTLLLSLVSTDVSCGNSFSLVVSNSNVFVSGTNDYEIGGPASTVFTQVNISEPIVSVSAGGAHALALSSSGNVWVAGSNTSGQSSDSATAGNFVQLSLPVTVSNISAGSTTTYISSNVGTVFCQGTVLGLSYASPLYEPEVAPLTISTTPGLTLAILNRSTGSIISSTTVQDLVSDVTFLNNIIYLGVVSGSVLTFDTSLNPLGSKSFGTSPMILRPDQLSNVYVLSSTYATTYDSTWSDTFASSNVVGVTDLFNNLYYTKAGTFLKKGSWANTYTNCTITDFAVSTQTGQLAACGFYTYSVPSTSTIDYYTLPVYFPTGTQVGNSAGFVFSFDTSGNINPLVPTIKTEDFLSTEFNYIFGTTYSNIFTQPYYSPPLLRYPPSSLDLVPPVKTPTLPITANITRNAWGNGTYIVNCSTQNDYQYCTRAFDILETNPGWQTSIVQNIVKNNTYTQFGQLTNINTVTTGNNIFGQFGQVIGSDTWTFQSLNYDFVSISEGNSFTAAIDTIGNLWTMGLNTYGQLGLGDTNTTTSFSQVPSVSAVSMVSCGDSHMAMIINGSVWSCGLNSFGQLGLGTFTNSLVPTFTGFTNFMTISCGSFHTVGLKNDGTIWVTGLNGNGQLGTNNLSTLTAFTNIINPPTATAISAGDAHTILVYNSQIWSTGLNDSGQLGLGDTVQRKVFSQVTVGNSPTNTLSCGNKSSMYIDSSGQTWGSGYNILGQLAIGTYSNTSVFTVASIPGEYITQISCGQTSYTSVLTQSGKVYYSGSNVYQSSGSGGDPANQFLTIQLPNPIFVSSVYIVEPLLSKATPSYSMNVYNYSTQSWQPLFTNLKGNIIDTNYNRRIDCVVPTNNQIYSDKYSYIVPNLGPINYSLVELALYSFTQTP